MDVFSEEYLNWLAEKTKEGKTIFYEDGFDPDNPNSGIELMFKEVDDYVKTFYYLNVEDYGNVYNVRDRKNLYTLSMFHGPSIAYTIKRDETKDSYLDLEDVRRRLLSGQENVAIYDLMKEISINLRKLYGMDVSMETVSEVIDKEMRFLKMNQIEEEKGYTRTLKQK